MYKDYEQMGEGGGVGGKNVYVKLSLKSRKSENLYNFLINYNDVCVSYLSVKTLSVALYVMTI